MASASVSSSTSSRKKRLCGSQCGALERGPVTIDGVVYLKVRRCPLCTLTNTDDNIVPTGPLSETPKMMWNQGTSTNPVNRIHRVCWMTWTYGGFAAEYDGDLDNFLEKRKEPEIQAEWAAAHQSLLKLAPDMPARLGKVVQKNVAEELATTRKVAVHAYKRREQTARAGYRAILVSKFEKENPGKIAAKKLPTRMINVEGQKRHVVLVRKLPQGEWDLDFEEIQGSSLTEDPWVGRSTHINLEFCACSQKSDHIVINCFIFGIRCSRIELPRFVRACIRCVCVVP